MLLQRKTKIKSWTQEEDETLRSLYGTMSYKDMVPIFNVNRYRIARRAQILGIAGTDPNIKSLVKRIYTLNENFFSEQTPLSCYWAGFIAADGYLNKKDSGVGIGLQRRDRGHLEAFLEDIGSTSKVVDFMSSCRETKDLPSSRVCIYNKNLRKDLEDTFNLTTKKSLTYSPPNFKDEETELAFFKGMIDGDGTTNERNNVVHVALCGSEHTIDWAEALMENISEKRPHQKRGRYHYPERNKVHIVKCSGTRAFEILSTVRSSVERELYRKWGFLDDFVKTTHHYNRKNNHWWPEMAEEKV